MGSVRGLANLSLASVLLAAVACGDDSSSGGGSGGDGDGDASASWLEDGFPVPDYADYSLNLNCPSEVGPFEGTGAPRGACCHRGEPNSARMVDFDRREESGDLEPDEVLIMSFRLNDTRTINQPQSVGATPIPEMGEASRDVMGSALLVQFGMPRAGGERASGPGFLQVGSGHYNCDDGTFSFYSDQAAPIADADFDGADDPGRVAPYYLPAMMDGDKDGVEATIIAFEDRPKGLVYSPAFDSMVDEYAWDYDLITQDFDILSFSTDPEDSDCQGERDGDTWVADADGMYEAYVPMAINNQPGNGVKSLLESSVCQLLAFGIVLDPASTLDCETSERCEPDTADCPWIKLPDSLCPADEEEAGIFSCHVGDEGHEPEFDGDEVRCTQDAPTAHDPDAETNGQCCDPLGASDTLPACNAWRTLNSFVAASAEIREDRADTMFRSCAQQAMQ